MDGKSRLPFELDDRIDESLLTAHAGGPLLIELFRASGGADRMDRQVSPKERRRGLSASQSAESLFARWAAGGERCADMDRIRQDRALSELSG